MILGQLKSTNHSKASKMLQHYKSKIAVFACFSSGLWSCENNGAGTPQTPTHLCLVELSIIILKQVPWSTTPCWLHLMLRKDSLAHEALWFGSPMKPTKRLTTESTSWSRKQTVVEKSLKKHGVNNKFLNLSREKTPNLGQESWQSSWLAWFLSRWQTCVAFMQMVRRNLSSCFKGLHEQQALNQKLAVKLQMLEMRLQNCKLKNVQICVHRLWSNKKGLKEAQFNCEGRENMNEMKKSFLAPWYTVPWMQILHDHFNVMQWHAMTILELSSVRATPSRLATSAVVLELQRLSFRLS